MDWSNSPEICSRSGRAALSPEPSSAGTPAPACACWSAAAADGSSPAGPSAPLSAEKERLQGLLDPPRRARSKLSL